MRRPSTRAEVSRWEFSNEYHFGDFHGKANEMLRRGYDVHLHYANFGIRRLMFRLPSGLSWSPIVFDAYHVEYMIDRKRDNEGNAGVLCFEPEADAGTYDEDFFEFDHLTAALPGLRQMLIRGDLRPLYLAWLACVGDEDAMEPPVPAGLSQLTRELDALCEFYELSPDLVAAAAESSPAAPPAQDEQRWLQKWIDDRPVE